MVNNRLAIELAAEKLFAFKGFRTTTIREIAKCAGVSSAMISYYFKSKDQLLIEIFAKHTLALNEIADDLLVSKTGALEKIYRLVDYYTDAIINHGQLVYIFLQEQLVKSCPSSVSILEEFNARHLSLFSEIINAGISQGDFQSEIKVSMLFFNILGTLRYIVIEYHNLMLCKDNASLEFVSYTMQEANRYLKSLLAIQLLPPFCGHRNLWPEIRKVQSEMYSNR